MKCHIAILNATKKMAVNYAKIQVLYGRSGHHERSQRRCVDCGHAAHAVSARAYSIDNIKVTFSVALLPCALYLVTVTDTDGAKRSVKLMKR